MIVLVYCRGAPFEYCSFHPSSPHNLLHHPFPTLTKSDGQRYACVIIRSDIFSTSANSRLNSRRQKQGRLTAGGGNGGNGGMAASPSVFLSEISAVREVVLTSTSRLDCLRFAALEADTLAKRSSTAESDLG